MPEIRIAGRQVGRGHSVFVVAELSANHNGSLDRALATVRAAAACGVDAIKLQTYTADTLTIQCDRPDFVVPSGPWSGRTLYDLYEEAHTPWEWHDTLFDEARRCGVGIFSTPFDESAVVFLEGLAVPAYKVASFELVDDELLRVVARTGKPVILSTGMATADEVVHAMAVLRASGCRELMLLQCTSSYPAPDDAMNLAAIPVLSELGSCPVGLSDHSIGTVAPVVAVALGASLIEKHFTLCRADGGVDSHFSLEPAEMADLVAAVRRAERMVGASVLVRDVAEDHSAVFRRSLYVVRDIEAGERFTLGNVRSIRPGFGLAPRHLGDVIGQVALRPLRRGTALTWDDVRLGATPTEVPR